MRVLVCNDDGFGALGVELLAEAALALSLDTWIIAPERKWTAASHQLSFDRDLTLTRVREHAYICSGAPADCVVAAMAALFLDEPKPDLVLAGVNDKRNVGEDVAYSGTMAIAREATFWGVPAIAMSQINGVTGDMQELPVLRGLLQTLWQSRQEWAVGGQWLSVSLPASLPAPLVQARISRDKIASRCEVRERTPERITYRLRRERPGSTTPGDENAHLRDGNIAVVRHRWDADAPLSDALIAAWSEKITRVAEK